MPIAAFSQNVTPSKLASEASIHTAPALSASLPAISPSTIVGDEPFSTAMPPPVMPMLPLTRTYSMSGDELSRYRPPVNAPSFSQISTSYIWGEEFSR